MIDSIVKYVRGFVGIRGKTSGGDYVDVAVDDSGNVQISEQAMLVNPLPSFEKRNKRVLSAGSSVWSTFVMVDDVALTDFSFGGRGAGKGCITKINTADSQLVPGGGFNSTADRNLWTYTGLNAGAITAPSPDYSTVQSQEGTGSLRMIYASSDANRNHTMTYTWSTAQDMSLWRYVSARFFNDATTAVTRTVSVILTDINGATRFYSLSGTAGTTLASNTWLQILGDLEIPTSETGTFDIYNVISIGLRWVDSGNKSGTIYWDNVTLLQSIDIIECIYVSANTTSQLNLRPSKLLASGETLGLLIKNYDTSAKEFIITAKGILA